jgi:Fe2+ transport system protein FeoA
MFAQQQDERATPQDTAPRYAPQYVLADVPLYCRARVVDVSALPAAQREQLQGYGIHPGTVMHVMQRTPVTVVQIEHTELAIETEIARAISVDELG